MTPDERALLGAVLADPRDDLPRLVYADWLEEHTTDRQCWACQGYGTLQGSGPDRSNPTCDVCSGTGRVSNGNSERAEFIRVQVELARIDPLKCWHPEGSTADCRQCGALRRRERELWSGGENSFAPQLAGLVNRNAPGACLTHWGTPNQDINSTIRGTWVRGFVESVRAPLGVLFGGECPGCIDGVIESAEFGVTPCQSCSGTGRTAGAAADVFASQPVTEVVLTDREPWTIRHDAFGWYDFAHPGLGASHDESLLPTDLFDLLPLEGRNTDADPRGGRTGRRDYWAWYSSRSLALSALSAACVARGRGTGRGWDHEGECPECGGSAKPGYVHRHGKHGPGYYECGTCYDRDTDSWPLGSGRARRPGLGPLRTTETLP